MSKFSIKERVLSFKYAFDGLKVLFKDEHNAWIHACFAILAVLLGILLDISFLEWIAIIISIGFVFSIEILNTAIEHIANFIQPNQDIKIKAIKDLAAAAVMVSAFCSFLVGVVIYLPKLLALFP